MQGEKSLCLSPFGTFRWEVWGDSTLLLLEFTTTADPNRLCCFVTSSCWRLPSTTGPYKMKRTLSHTHDFFFLKKLQTVKSIFENDPLEIDDFEAKEFCGRV